MMIRSGNFLEVSANHRLGTPIGRVWITLVLLFLSLHSVCSLLAQAGGTPQKILFIRGGDGTVGFLEGGSNEQGADVFNYATNGGNHGWGELHAALVAEGFDVAQIAEDPVSGGVPSPIPLDTMNLNQYSVIVFGSNNAAYTTAQVNALQAYIGAGGSALFISDANFGQNWGDAPSSDQHFFDRFGLTMNQDTGTYEVRRTNEFVVPSHPILVGVDNFDGEGVSPITRGAPPAGVSSAIVSLARSSVRRNTGASRGPSESVTANDASLVVATYGSGRIAGHYDRNTFFNDNGAGTSINRFDNEVYARNLFNWLAGNPTGSSNFAPRGHFPNLLPGTSVFEGNSFATEVIAKDPDGSVSSVTLKVDGTVISTDTSAPYEFVVPGLSAGTRTLTASITDNLGATTDANLDIAVSDGGDIELPLDRSSWVLSASNNTGDLGSAIDGNLGSRWTTQQDQQPGQKFGIDFGGREIFQRIVLDSSNSPDDYPRGYSVRASDDGVNFVQIASGAGAGATTEIFLPAPATYRFLEIEQTGSSGNKWWSIHEINILHPPADSVLPLASWLQFYYGDSPPALSDDSDGDALTVLNEYAFNSSPAGDSNPLKPYGSVGVDPNDQQRFIDFTFRRWKIPADSDVDYVLQSSEDLNTWSSNGLNIQFPTSPIPNGDGTETVAARIKFDVVTARRFVRLCVVPK